MSSRIFNKLSKIYYSPQGYWKGFAAIKKLAQAAKVSEDVVQNWLMKQALWQVYLPAPRYIPRPKFDVPVPNKVHQADLLYLPHDHPPRSRKTFKYTLTVVDVASRYKEAEPLTTKEAKEVAAALERIYNRGPLKWPKLLQVDPGREFMGAVNQLLSKHNVEVRRGRVAIHRDQAIVALNKEVTRLTGQKPVDVIKKKTVPSKPSTPYLRPVGVNENKLPSGLSVRYLYQPGELEGGRRRATDPIWSLNVYEIDKIMIKPDAPVIYYLFDGPKRWFVREELLVVPPETQHYYHQSNNETRSVLCEYRLPIPSVCRSRHSTPASAVRK